MCQLVTWVGLLDVVRGASSGLFTTTLASIGTNNTNSSLMEEEEPRMRAPPWHKDGPMPTISDSVFSLIILIYVSVIFVFMFFSFCWKEPDPPPPDPAHKNIPMITSMLEEMEKQELENKQNEANQQHGPVGNGSLGETQEMPGNLLLDHSEVDHGEQQRDPIVVSVITEKSSNIHLPPALVDKSPKAVPSTNGNGNNAVIPDPTQV
ncbi:hypothetical protein TCAL_15031 [Tigriopus californicus]|uniref:Neurotransmitter-gated ion-channel transmembrane domain-containing protein n=1 Tax=Tigriopus californicus TaxID=6832 RepID=A0A553P081_TIGCA|nr:hypothetical protein TCAL_15031 [Tigriopus californicus]